MHECQGCGGTVDIAAKAGHYKEITGYTRIGSGGRTSPVELRKDTDRFMHRECVEAIKAGRSPDQMSLDLEIPGQTSLQELS